MKKIKVLHILEKFDQGGIENFILNILKNIDRDEFEFHFAIRSGEVGVMDEEIRQLGGMIHYMSGKKDNTKQDLTEILKKFGPFDTVHSHLYFFSGYLLGIAKKMGVPVRISHSHETYKGQKYTFSRKIYENYMRALINKNATYKVGCSTAACKHLYGKIDEQTFVVHNAIDLSKYRPNISIRERVRKKLRVQNNILIGHVGRFEDQKDHDFLIDIFNGVHKLDSNYKLLLIGNGSLKDNIKKKVHDSGLDEAVIFLENRNDVNELMQAMDLFVFPSKYEGLGIVAIEAQAAGLNGIVSSSIPQEANVTNTLVVLDKANPAKWIDTIISLKGKPRIDNIEQLRLSKYDIKDTVKQVSDLYKNKL